MPLGDYYDELPDLVRDWLGEFAYMYDLPASTQRLRELIEERTAPLDTTDSILYNGLYLNIEEACFADTSWHVLKDLEQLADDETEQQP